MGMFVWGKPVFLSFCLFTFGLLGEIKMTFGAKPDSFFAINRKRVKDPESILVEKLNALSSQPAFKNQFIRMLDFNIARESESKINIINAATPQKAVDIDYASLSNEERAEMIFRPFSDQLISQMNSDQSPKVFHIDHHYSFSSLRKTSTTVLAVDFILWIHQEINRHSTLSETYQKLLAALESSFALVDHSDADILLSNFVIDHALDSKFLESIAPLLRGVALYNDYLAQTEIDSRLQSQIYILFDCVLELERQIAEDPSFYAQASTRIKEFIELLNQIEKLLGPAIPDLESELWNQKDTIRTQMSPRLHEALDSFMAGYQDYAEQVEILRRLKLGQEIKAHDSAIVVEPGLQNRSIDSSVIVKFLKQERKDWLHGIQSVVSVIVDPNTQASFIKLRTLDEEMNLHPVYEELRSQGLEPGGRAAAGSAAFGKSGKKNVSREEMERTLGQVVNSLNRWRAHQDSCGPAMAKVQISKE